MITLNETSVASEVQCTSDSTDRQIDALVYELYRLTEGEIKIVEGNADRGCAI